MRTWYPKSKKYTEILYRTINEKEELYRQLTEILERDCPEIFNGISRKRMIDILIRRTLRTYWEIVMEDLIMKNETFAIGKKFRVSIAKIPLRNNMRMLSILRTFRQIVMFVSVKKDRKHRNICIRLKEKSYQQLQSELEKGHTYNFGIITF